MREMKDSGIEWIGEIPKDWVCCKQKYVIQLINGRAYSDSEFEENGKYPILRVGNLFSNPVWYSSSMELESDKYCEKGDLLYSWSMSYAPVIWEGNKVIYHYHIWKTKLNKSLDKKFAYYYLLSLTDALKAEIHETTMGFITMGIMNNSYIALPTFAEQQRIASFLDTKCSEIDALAADIQAQIDTLEQYKRSVITETVTKGLDKNMEMKDSGLQWIGEIPAHWNYIRGKYILKYIQKPVREDDGVITCFRDGEVTLRSNRREDGFTVSDKEIGYQGIDVGDLVVHGMDGFAGAIGISDSRGKASPVLNVLDTNQNKKYVMYYLRSMASGNVFTALSTGIRVRSCDLRWNKLAELMYPIPPISEQVGIVKYIDSMLDKANVLIDEKKDQLTILDAYKKSLIYEYVTGKKEVPAV
jgi:type I restriction enzyme S subunit